MVKIALNNKYPRILQEFYSQLLQKQWLRNKWKSCFSSCYSSSLNCYAFFICLAKSAYQKFYCKLCPVYWLPIESDLQRSAINPFPSSHCICWPFSTGNWALCQCWSALHLWEECKSFERAAIFTTTVGFSEKGIGFAGQDACG